MIKLGLSLGADEDTAIRAVVEALQAPRGVA
jgi:hypothetical protein